MSNQLAKSFIAIKCVSKIMIPLVSWLIKSGVGYKDFHLTLKRIFFEQALAESKKSNYKITDSSLSLLAGLNRRDIIHFRENKPSDSDHEALSISSRVITLWVQKKWDKKIAFHGTPISFESLSREISQDTHPRTVLLDLERLGLVSEVGDTIILHSESFTPSNDSTKCQSLLSQSVNDHLQSGLINIFERPNSFLEQTLNADELTPESIEELRLLSTQLWKELSHKLLDKAIECSEKDKGKLNAYYRFSLGIHQYNEFQYLEEKERDRTLK
ncbi:hypothetical protein IF090_00855 [Acinetobacter towneri]|uniref:DUF6502 family protein n=1 Tax=Acinetobacter towneri TaxID=202956 RepID=UPI001CE07D81|nr:DUF6502 family protein [Acinetobacter towneri]MCA4778207.1 hypothetical protein [Acinetobacter towneri]MCA4783536.1 hypothetical protein [Acinetobacter towneri]MCA4786120.1 hypothetical protein [Acinetobacter towneri]MCA4794874.1 hypothetical protein [Acinetobacter towneri]MCA4799613.1 hypothetical protein [Acinetobacter towneri]